MLLKNLKKTWYHSPNQNLDHLKDTYIQHIYVSFQNINTKTPPPFN